MYEVKVRFINDTGTESFSYGDYTDKPCPCITKSSPYQHYIEYYLTDTPPLLDMRTDKPEYKVPSMEEIKAVPWNGYNAISTFSGCGGSSLGYKMAGFKVLWANEFIPIAAETYRLNHDGIVDERDIRQIQPEEILEAIGMKQGELDLMDGSPPCDSFSTAGKREKKWGKTKEYLGTKQRTDDLFFEYARILEGLQPKIFVAENVSGLIKGKSKGYFKLILQRLKDCGYNVKAKLLDAKWLGVPQMRQRIIFMGVRDDIDIQPVYPKPLGYNYTVRDAIEFIVNIDHDVKQATDYHATHQVIEYIKQCKPGEKVQKYHPKHYGFVTQRVHNGQSSPTICQTLGGTMETFHATERRLLTIPELKRICAFPDDFKLIGTCRRVTWRMTFPKAVVDIIDSEFDRIGDILQLKPDLKEDVKRGLILEKICILSADTPTQSLK